MSKTVPEYKLRVPKRDERIPRSRLFEYFRSRSGRRLIVIYGRAGQGKTSFAFDCLQQHNKSFSWYTVDSWDVSAQRIAAGLAAAVTGKIADLPEDMDRIEEEFIRLVSEAVDDAGEDRYLVIDDFDVLDPKSEAHSFVQNILNKLPEHVHLVIISRRLLSLELARLRSAKELVEIKDEDLAFKEEEIHLFFQKIARNSLPGGIIKRVFQLIGGWITGYVYLAERLEGLSSKKREDFLGSFIKNGSMPEVDEFFREEVMGRLSKREQEILISLGAVKEPREELVALLTGEEQACFLHQLWRSHTFIRHIDSEKDSYAFNTLFSRYLQKEFLRFERKKRGKTVKAVSEYYEKCNQYSKLVFYLLRVEELEKAKDVFVKYSDELYRTLGQDELRMLLESFPDKAREKDQTLSYYYALTTNLVRPVSTTNKLVAMVPSFLKNRDYEKIVTTYSVLLVNSLFYQRSNESINDIVSQADEFLGKCKDKIEDEQKEILESLIPLGKWRIGDNGEQAFRMALHAEETSFKFHNQEAYISARLVLSRIYIEKGVFNEAKRILQRTESFLETHNVSNLFKLLIAFYLGDTFFYLGEINTAIEWIEQALKRCPDDFAFRYYLELNLIIYYLYLDDISKADSLFEITENRETDEILLVKYFSRYLINMLVAYRNKNRQRAEYYADRLLEPQNESLLRTDFPYSYLALAEVLIFLEKYEEAKRIIASLQTDTFREDHLYPSASADALRALCSEKEGDKEGAEEAVGSMLSIIKERHYRNLDIVDPDLLDHLADLADDPVFSEFPRLTGRREQAARTENTSDLTIKTLGAFKVYFKGEEITTSLLSSQKRVMDLLKLLIVHRKNGVMKERVYEIFWPRYSYKSVRDNLNTIIYRLRKLFGNDANFLVTDVNMIYFLEGKIHIDIDDFLDYYNRGRAAEKHGNLETAISLYKIAEEVYEGDFLGGDLYFDFIRDQREELKNCYRQVLFSLARLTLSIGEYGNAIDWSKKLIAADNLCEPAYRLIMIASAFIGNRSVIPQFYDELNRRLQAAYSLTVDERTRELRDKLLSGSPVDSSFWEEERLI
ncbi:MAG: BTAD domain-containing putative transcriptional regulator [Spirochaetaceae bacterium]